LTTYLLLPSTGTKRKGANSSLGSGRITGIDKSDSKLQNIPIIIFKAHLIYRVSFLVAAKGSIE
jgi:hypothetical protein